MSVPYFNHARVYGAKSILSVGLYLTRLLAFGDADTPDMF